MKHDSIRVSFSGKELKGKIVLDGSKSISNRALIIRALTENPAEIHHLSTSDDTVAMQHILNSESTEHDAGAAGTTFRFLTAYFAATGAACTLTGTKRMQNRPIGDLVNALRILGADIEYLGREGYPPLRFNPGKLDKTNELTIASHISSQFISALLLIAPTLPDGLILHLEGDMVSRSYIELTLHIMEYFGISWSWENQTIIIAPQKYKARKFTVESDWSAASYYYGIAALLPEAELHLGGLGENTFQGDGAVARLYEEFGVKTEFGPEGIILKRSGLTHPDSFEHDFIQCPDIAQTMAVTCAATGTDGLFSGLQTLSIKETDRISAVRNELKKIGVSFTKMPSKFSEKTKVEYHFVSGKADFREEVSFPTYEDHRMAMAFAPLAVLHPIRIEEPDVVAKSYPLFWEDLKSLGFRIE